VLYDDRTSVGAGGKFNDSDLLGIPARIVISKKTFAQEKFEVKKRSEVDAVMLTKTELMDLVK
jgi:prolyl-tRNA synthetase